jgi:hypothetical protein
MSFSAPPRLAIARGVPIENATPIALRDVATGAAPRQRTEVRLACTETALCIQFEAEDREPWATLTERDAPLYEEEVVEVFIDPAGDLAGYFEIEVNPLGTVLDLLIRRNRRGLLKDFRWRCEGLRTSVAKTATGWRADLHLPWLSIVAEPPPPGALWRANFTRIDRPPGQPRELTAWSPTGLELFHVPDRFGFLEFA